MPGIAICPGCGSPVGAPTCSSCGLLVVDHFARRAMLALALAAAMSVAMIGYVFWDFRSDVIGLRWAARDPTAWMVADEAAIEDLEAIFAWAGLGLLGLLGGTFVARRRPLHGAMLATIGATLAYAAVTFGYRADAEHLIGLAVAAPAIGYALWKAKTHHAIMRGTSELPDG